MNTNNYTNVTTNNNNRIFTNDYFMEIPIERYRNELKTYIQSLLLNCRSITTTTTNTNTTSNTNTTTATESNTIGDNNNNNSIVYYYDTIILKQILQEHIPWNKLCTYYNIQHQHQNNSTSAVRLVSSSSSSSSSSFVTTTTTNKRSILDELLTILINPFVVPTCCLLDCIVPVLLLQILTLQQQQHKEMEEKDELSSMFLSCLESSVAYTLSVSQKRILKTINTILFRHCSIVYVYHYIPTILITETIIPYIVLQQSLVKQNEHSSNTTTCSSTDNIHIILQQLSIVQNNILYTSWMKEIQLYEQYKNNFSSTFTTNTNNTSTCSIIGTIYNQMNYPKSTQTTLCTLYTFYQCFILLLQLYDRIDTILHTQIHTLKEQQQKDCKINTSCTIQDRSNAIISYTTLKYKKHQLIQFYKIRVQCFTRIISIIQSSILITSSTATTPTISTIPTTTCTNYTTLFKDFINILLDTMMLQENKYVQEQIRQRQQNEQQQHDRSDESIRLQILFIISLFEKSNVYKSSSLSSTTTSSTSKHDYYSILLRTIRDRIRKQIEFILGHIVPLETTTTTTRPTTGTSASQQIRIANLCIVLSYYSEIIVICSNFDNPNKFRNAFNSYTLILHQLFTSYTTTVQSQNDDTQLSMQQRTNGTMKNIQHYDDKKDLIDTKISAVCLRQSPLNDVITDSNEYADQQQQQQQQHRRRIIQQLHHDMIVPFLNCLGYILTYRGTMVSKCIMSTSTPVTTSASTYAPKQQSLVDSTITSNLHKHSNGNNKVSSPTFQNLLRNISHSFNNVNYWINSLQYCGITRLCDNEKNLRIKALQEFGILGRVVYDDDHYRDKHPCFSILQPQFMNINSSEQILPCQFVLKLPGFSGCEQISDMVTRISFSFTENIVQCCSRKSTCDKDKDVSIFSPYSRNNKLPPGIGRRMMSSNQNNGEVYQFVNLNVDLMKIIFSYLPYQSLLHVRKVCSTWKSISDTDKLWIDLYKSTYGFLPNDPAVIPKHDNLVEHNLAATTVDTTATTKTTDGTVTKSNWKRFFQDRCQSEWIIRFRYNPNSMWKWKVCPYVGCLHIMKTKKLMKKHLEQHVHKIEYQNQQQQIQLERMQQELLKQQEKLIKQQEKIQHQQEKLQQKKQQQLQKETLSKRKQISKIKVDDKRKQLVEPMKSNQLEQSSSSSKRKRIKHET